MLDAEKQAGRLGPGQPKKNGNETEPFSRVTLDQIGIDKQLSSRSQKIPGIGEQVFKAMVESVRDRIAKGDRVALDVTQGTVWGHAGQYAEVVSTSK
ncbi:hypothetical protein [Bradyrhizobium sp. Tv2a-2]|uniref:hypothetical protein n=1 Tax=Bradyrhizobium sp. Tv2a-2 TaxID=113395 RepID=UPI0012EB623B|nr:hypothetical protein [Bradyrhizobium sp. Tv2a-2]